MIENRKKKEKCSVLSQIQSIQSTQMVSLKTILSIKSIINNLTSWNGPKTIKKGFFAFFQHKNGKNQVFDRRQPLGPENADSAPYLLISYRETFLPIFDLENDYFSS